MAIMLLGFMGFTPAQFWLSLPATRSVPLRSQRSTTSTTPSDHGNSRQHRRRSHSPQGLNKLLTLVGAVCYTVSFLLLALQTDDSSYWALVFPSLLLMVVGADFEFNVANVRHRPY
jgi:hypothetical protein